MEHVLHQARFNLGQIVRHRDSAFQGLIMDVDHSYAGPWEETGPVCPDQPFYYVLVLQEGGGVMAYAAEDVLEDTPDVEPLSGDDVIVLFTVDGRGRRAPRDLSLQ